MYLSKLPESMNEATPNLCDLCSSPIQVPDFHVMTRTGLKQFCCEGCEGVYRMLHEDEVVDDNPSTGAGSQLS
jgi:hypothetical protein